MKNCADRGMVSEANRREIKCNGFDYILGVRMRNAKYIGNKLIFDKSPFEVVKENLHVKEVRVGEDRLIVCFNPEQAEKDKRTREAILSKLKEKLQKGPKQLVGNGGYARFLILNYLQKMWPYPTKGSGKLNVVSGILKAPLR